MLGVAFDVAGIVIDKTNANTLIGGSIRQQSTTQDTRRHATAATTTQAVGIVAKFMDRALSCKTR
ncbi:hypothetical protein RRF57_004905 [Xylaria bambusicola]|uniref:Uncharacterized protein n=1 Tax=Xylaria bambusicola TaxID=326684 RepID=A0AAN7UB48_9PEZI